VDSISNTEFVLSKFADYSGAAPANVDKMTFRVYQDPAAAYADAVAGSLDYIDESNIPQDQFVGDAYRATSPTATRSASPWSTAGSRSRPTTRS
jgi:oligopeptide transport system substrate-binding protein